MQPKQPCARETACLPQNCSPSQVCHEYFTPSTKLPCNSHGTSARVKTMLTRRNNWWRTCCSWPWSRHRCVASRNVRGRNVRGQQKRTALAGRTLARLRALAISFAQCWAHVAISQMASGPTTPQRRLCSTACAYLRSGGTRIPTKLWALQRRTSTRGASSARRGPQLPGSGSSSWKAMPC